MLSLFKIDWKRDWSRLSIISRDFGNGRAIWVAVTRGHTASPVNPLGLVEAETLGL